MKKDDCIFCKIAAGEIPSRKIYEDSDLIAIMDLNPTSKGHSLIIPKEHCTNIYDIDEDIQFYASLNNDFVMKILPQKS